jgi:hypothetical protein
LSALQAQQQLEHPSQISINTNEAEKLPCAHDPSTAALPPQAQAAQTPTTPPTKFAADQFMSKPFDCTFAWGFYSLEDFVWHFQRRKMIPLSFQVREELLSSLLQYCTFLQYSVTPERKALVISSAPQEKETCMFFP